MSADRLVGHDRVALARAVDLRLADLWREACDVSEWNLDVVAAIMRAAYGKGYCDALTEDSPGALCQEHGYRVPDRRPAPTREA